MRGEKLFKKLLEAENDDSAKKVKKRSFTNFFIRPVGLRLNHFQVNSNHSLGDVAIDHMSCFNDSSKVPPIVLATKEGKVIDWRNANACKEVKKCTGMSQKVVNACKRYFS